MSTPAAATSLALSRFIVCGPSSATLTLLTLRRPKVSGTGAVVEWVVRYRRDVATTPNSRLVIVSDRGVLGNVESVSELAKTRRRFLAIQALMTEARDPDPVAVPASARSNRRQNSHGRQAGCWRVQRG